MVYLLFLWIFFVYSCRLLFFVGLVNGSQDDIKIADGCKYSENEVWKKKETISLK